MTANVGDWYVLELSASGTQAMPDEVERSLHSVVGEAEVFVPAFVAHPGGDDALVMDVYEGYIFVRRGAYDPNDLLCCPLVARFLMRGSGSRVCPVLLGDEDIQAMRATLDQARLVHVEPGDVVEVVGGLYERLQGVVIGVGARHEDASIRLSQIRSKEVVVTLPACCLRVVERPGS